MTKQQIDLIAKWRGQICGPRVTFPSAWHKEMYKRECNGTLPKPKKVTKSIWSAAHA